MKYTVWDFESYNKHVNEWREFFQSELVSYFKMNAILRHNYQHLDIEQLDDDKFVLIFSEYLWVREYDSRTTVATNK